MGLPALFIRMSFYVHQWDFQRLNIMQLDVADMAWVLARYF